MKKLLIIAAIAASALSSCTMVDSAEVGIKFSKFGLTDKGELDAVTVSGFNIYNPFSTSVYTYPTFIQRVDYKAFQVMTKDAAEFSMDPVMAYQLNRSMAVQVFAKYRRPLDEIEQGYMRTAIYDAYRIVANRYTADELMANRAQFESQVYKQLDSTLNKEGFIVSEFTSQIIPPQSLSIAIEAKNKAVQEALKAENEVAKADAEAKIEIAKAEGAAKAMKIKADAEAYYNRTISASLSPMIVQEDWIEKWDGKLPTYQAGNGQLPYIMMK